MQKRSLDHKLEYIICHCINASTITELTSIFEREGVNAHFAITPAGEIVEYIHPDYIAHHAGVSAFHNLETTPINPLTGNPTLNFTSLGIEFLSPGYAKDGDWYHFEPFTEEQKIAGVELITRLMKDYNIDRHKVLGHSDIAPLRKTDPGAKFFWDYLDEHEIGMPLPPKDYTAEPYSVVWAQETLKKIGYVTTPQTGILDDDTKRIIRAFQLHFVPSLFLRQGFFLEDTKALIDPYTYGALEFLLKYPK